MSEYRWPEAECYHTNIAFSMTVRLFTGEIINHVPSHCMDCGKTFEDNTE